MSVTLSRLQEIVGKGNVFEKPDFSSSSAGLDSVGNNLAPDFLVKTQNTDQVQQIVKLANELSLPLIPVSSSDPHNTGGVRPDMPGTVIVDLSGMKKILKVDKHHRLALIEPGVTWEELGRELTSYGLRIAQPLLPKKGKSVIASLLDREPMISPKFQWNMTEPLRSMEIIFGTGDKIYSGMGGHRGDTDEAWENGTVPLTNAGPHQLDFMKMVTASQGTMGIVTWASVKVESLAVEEKAVFVESNSLAALSGFVQKIVKMRFGDETCIFNRKNLAAILAFDGSQLQSIEEKLAPWTAIVNIKWGALRAKEKVASQYADILEIAQESGLVTSSTVAGIPVTGVVGRMLSLEGNNSWKTKATGLYKEIFFLSTMNRVPDQLKAAASAADEGGYPISECPVYIQPLHQGTAVHCHIILPLTAAQADSTEMKELYARISKKMASEGAFYSRPYGIWAGMMYENNTQHTNLTLKMKDIFDPRHIMNPGKLCF